MTARLLEGIVAFTLAIMAAVSVAAIEMWLAH